MKIEPKYTDPSMMGNLSVKIIPVELFRRIEDLYRDLREHYGCDFAFTICAQGHIIAASNLKDGVIFPRLTKEDRIP